MEEQAKINPLGTEKVSSLMIKFAIPSIVAMMIGAVYNIVDQLFIGNAVGTLGNAATNVVFPLTTCSTALALLLGMGGSACFNLSMGENKTEKAVYFVGNALTMMAVCGVLLCVVTQVFMSPFLHVFGTPDDVFPYAQDYLRITAVGFPFLVLTIGGGHIMRADGSPHMTMICSLTGAIINTVLDALFVMVFRWGMQGAALATIIGQIVSAVIIVLYMRKFKTAPLEARHLRLRLKYIKRIVTIGIAPCFNQICMVIVQLIINNSLTYYGGLSVYGEAIPLACAGIIMKVSQIFNSVVIGVSQGAQPILSFNYGARQFDRVRQCYLTGLFIGAVICVASFLVYWFFPRQILEWFGSNTEEYFEFGVLFFHTFLFFTWLNFLQPLTSNYLTSVGKPKKGVFLSLTRQLIFVTPLLIFLPLKFGVMGILYAAPLADVMTAVVTIIMARIEVRQLKVLSAQNG